MFEFFLVIVLIVYCVVEIVSWRLVCLLINEVVGFFDILYVVIGFDLIEIGVIVSVVCDEMFMFYLLVEDLK